MEEPADPASAAAREQSRIEAKLYEIAAETGYPKETIHWIWWIICSRPTTEKSSESPAPGVDAEAVCELVIRDFNDLYPGALNASLDHCGIYRSEDIGSIVYALVEKDLLIAEPGDSPCDFNGLFTLEELDAYLRAKGIRRRLFAAPGALRRLFQALYWGGIIIVVGGWVKLVPYPHSWIGWVIGMIGWAGLHWVQRRA